MKKNKNKILIICGIILISLGITSDPTSVILVFVGFILGLLGVLIEFE